MRITSCFLCCAVPNCSHVSCEESWPLATCSGLEHFTWILYASWFLSSIVTPVSLIHQHHYPHCHQVSFGLLQQQVGPPAPDTALSALELDFEEPFGLFFSHNYVAVRCRCNSRAQNCSKSCFSQEVKWRQNLWECPHRSYSKMRYIYSFETVESVWTSSDFGILRSWQIWLCAQFLSAHGTSTAGFKELLLPSSKCLAV